MPWVKLVNRSRIDWAMPFPVRGLDNDNRASALWRWVPANLTRLMSREVARRRRAWQAPRRRAPGFNGKRFQLVSKLPSRAAARCGHAATAVDSVVRRGPDTVLSKRGLNDLR